MSEESFTEVLDTNLTGAYRVAKRAVRPMMKMRRGRMIFISSVVGLYGSGGQANYAASKAGLVGLARSLARELGSRNITANVIAPGFVDSDMTAVLSDERKAAIIGAVPLGRYASADEVGGRGRVPGRPGRRLRHRRRHPGRRRPRHGPLSARRCNRHIGRHSTCLREPDPSATAAEVERTYKFHGPKFVMYGI